MPAKCFNILATSLNVLHNYYVGPNEIIFRSVSKEIFRYFRKTVLSVYVHSVSSIILAVRIERYNALHDPFLFYFFVFRAMNYCKIATGSSIVAIITEKESGQGWVAFLKMTYVNRAFITRVCRAYL